MIDQQRHLFSAVFEFMYSSASDAFEDLSTEPPLTNTTGEPAPKRSNVIRVLSFEFTLCMVYLFLSSFCQQLHERRAPRVVR